MIEYICSFEEEYGFLVSESMKYGEELIRCKDCKHMHEDGAESYCDDSGRYIDGTGFCKWAEKKE